MSLRVSGSKTGFGNLLDTLRYEARSKNPKSALSESGLKVAIVLYVFKQGEKIPHLSDWAANDDGGKLVRLICFVDGYTDSIPQFIEDDFNKSLNGGLTSDAVMSSSLGRYPVFTARNQQLPVPVPGDGILVSFSERRGVVYGIYEDFYSAAFMQTAAAMEGETGDSGAGGGNGVSRVLQNTQKLQEQAKSSTASGYFAKFKLAYNKDTFRNNLAKTMNELKAFSKQERKKLAFRIAAWDAVMGGDGHTISSDNKRTGFDCIGQNAKTLALAYYLTTGSPYVHPLGRGKTLQLVQDGKFVYSGFIHYLSFEGSNDLIYKQTGKPLNDLKLGSAGISKRFKVRDGYIGTFGHIYTLVDRIGDITIWCEGRTARTTRLTVMGGDGTAKNLNLADTDWSGMDESGVGRETNAYSKKFWGNGDGVPATKTPYAYIGELTDSW